MFSIRGKFNIETSIKERPNAVKKRLEFGHWELDTVLSPRGKSKECLVTFAERKSRFYIALKMPNRSKESMISTVNQLIQIFPKRTDLVKITEHELFNAQWLINNRPRKCLDFKTPFEVLMHELVQLE